MIDKSKYVDIKNAVKLTGKSESTIRNLLRGLSTDEKKKYVEREGLKIWILRAFLEKKYTANEDQNEIEKSILATIEILSRQLEKKDKQIEELIERLKEANYNQGSMHKFLNDLGLSESEIQKRLK